MRASLLVLQDYFPEHLGQMFIINTPMIFKAIWAVVYQMLEERTRKKIVVLGASYKVGGSVGMAAASSTFLP